MNRPWQSIAFSIAGSRPRVPETGWILALLALVLGGCQGASQAWWGMSADQPQPPQRAEADSPYVVARSVARPAAQRQPVERIDVLLRVLYVQVPRSERTAITAMWEQLREDALDCETRARLHANGVRVGVGRTERWNAVQAALNAIEGARIHEFPPLRARPGFPLALELDAEPAGRTIFYLDRDGIISGDTWPASRRVLRVTYTLDVLDVDRVCLSVVPEVRRRVDFDLLRGQDGLTMGPRRDGRAFAAAAFAVALGPSEFVLMAPGEKADVFGLVGGVFLTERLDGRPHNSYVFLRADVTHVKQGR